MEKNNVFQELSLILVVSILLGISFLYPGKGIEYFIKITGIFLVILLINLYAKRFFAYNLEADVSTKIWSMGTVGFKQSQRFKKPLPMLWLPILTTLATRGSFIWLPLLEFDIAARPERVSRRHGLYRFTEITEWHIALIAVAGIFANLVGGIIGYFAGFEEFAKWSIYYAVWSIIPISSLDGTKILMGSKYLWFTLIIILAVIFSWSLVIF